MSGVQSYLYLAAIALWVFSTAILRSRQERAGRPLRWFTAFLSIETLGFVCELLMIHPAVPLKAAWLALRMAASLLVAPCLLLAFRESVEGTPSSALTLGRGYWATMVAGIALLLPLAASAHLGLDYPNRLHPISTAQARVIHATMLGCIFIFAVQVPFCLWQCRQLLFGRDQTLNWLQLPSLVVVTTWVLGLLRTVQCASHGPPALNVWFAFADVSVAVGAIYVLVSRAPLLESMVATEAKYARSALDGALRQRIKDKLQAALGAQELHRDSLLNLRSLSQAMKEKSHYVSQVINQDLDASFYELVNRYRIEGAKKLLIAAPEQTVLEIALAVGFNSKSTFNTAFRHNTGLTPTEFRAQGQPKKPATPRAEAMPRG